MNSSEKHIRNIAAIEKGKQRVYEYSGRDSLAREVWGTVAIEKRDNRYYLGVHELSSENVSLEEFDREEYWTFDSMEELELYVKKVFQVQLSDFTSSKGQKFVFDLQQLT